MLFLDILVFFRLDLGQISFNLVENAFAARQLALAASIAFYPILARACVFRLCDFWFFFGLYFFSFSFLFAAVIDLLLGLLAVKKNFLKSVIETGNFYHGAVRCSGRKFCSIKVFHSAFWAFLCISQKSSIRPITLIWASLERSFPSAEVEYRWCHFWSKVMTSEVEERPRLAQGRHRSQWVNNTEGG